MRDTQIADHQINEFTELDEDRLAGLPLSGVVIALVFLVLLAYITPRGFLVHSLPQLGSDNALPPSAVSMVLLMVGVNTLLRLSRVKFRLQKRAMAVAFNMIMVGGLVSSTALVLYLPYNMMQLQYWVEENMHLVSFYNAMSTLVLPKNAVAVDGFWWGEQTVPWGDWVVPIVLWSVFFGAIFWVILCLITLIYSHWTEREHLMYPLVVPVMTLIQGHDMNVASDSVWKSRLRVIGILISAVFAGSQTLHRYYPFIPQISSVMLELNPIFEGMAEPWRTAFTTYMGFPSIQFNPLLFGIGYLVALDVSFSIWFFYIVYMLWRVGATMMGANMLEPITGLHQPVSLVVGSFVGILFYTVYNTRHQIREMWVQAFSNQGGDDTARNQPLPFRVAAFGGLLGVVVVIAFAVIFLHLTLLVAVLFFLIFFAATITVARLRAEAGWPLTKGVGNRYEFDVLAKGLGAGGRLFGEGNLGGSAYLNTLSYGAFGGLGAVVLETYKIGDEARLKRKSNTYALLIAFFVAIALGFLFTLPVIYKHGAFMLEYHFRATGTHTILNLTSVSNPQAAEPYVFIMTLVGAVGAVFLYQMRMMYVWWPFHPIGFALAPHDAFTQLFWPFLMAWIIKSLLRRYAGAKIMKDAEPLFVGLIIGMALMRVVDVVVGFITVVIG